MKRTFATVASAALLASVAACPLALAGDTKADTAGKAPDNTAVNVRDRGGDKVTAQDQAENEADRKVTQEVRKAIVDDDSLSTNAKNVKVITIDGVVTLRGPVANEQEKNKVAAKVSAVPGVKRLENQLEATAH